MLQRIVQWQRFCPTHTRSWTLSLALPTPQMHSSVRDASNSVSLPLGCHCCMGLLEHRLVDLNNRKLFSGGWGGQKSEDSGKALVHGLFQLVVAPGVLGLWLYHANLCRWSCYLLCFSQRSLCFFYKGTCGDI